jgi:pyruvate/2-oxoacid:ferredoxin oxidoreductase alpha subunit
MTSSISNTSETMILSGNWAACYGAKQAQVDLISAFPITPQTEILEKMAELIASGEMDARYVPAESEHSVMSILIGASRAGARVFSSTSGQGLMYMAETVQWAGRGRIPMVMCICNRSVGEPAGMMPDHDDSMTMRDPGWIQYYCETNQEVLDTVLQGFRVTESIHTPVMPCLDGFYLTHTYEPVEIPPVDRVASYIPKDIDSRPRIDPQNPYSFGWPVQPQSKDRFEHYLIVDLAKKAALEADEEFGEIFGRSWGIVEPYRCDDAELILVALGSMVSQCRMVADRDREKGRKTGVLKIRLFSPFPKEEVSRILSGARKVAVVNRGYSYGHGGQLTLELRSALYESGVRTPTYDFVVGVGGFDVPANIIQDIADYCYEKDPPQFKSIWMGVPSL